MISISFVLWQDLKEVPSPEKSIFLRKFNELKVDTFPCEKHSVRNSLNLFNIMIPNPITVSTIPEVIVILKEDGNLSLAGLDQNDVRTDRGPSYEGCEGS